MNTEFENLNLGDEISVADIKGYPPHMVIVRVYPNWYALEPNSDADLEEFRRKTICLDYVNLAAYRDAGRLEVFRK